MIPGKLYFYIEPQKTRAIRKEAPMRKGLHPCYSAMWTGTGPFRFRWWNSWHQTKHGHHHPSSLIFQSQAPATFFVAKINTHGKHMYYAIPKETQNKKHFWKLTTARRNRTYLHRYCYFQHYSVSCTRPPYRIFGQGRRTARSPAMMFLAYIGRVRKKRRKKGEQIREIRWRTSVVREATSLLLLSLSLPVLQLLGCSWCACHEHDASNES